MRVAAICLFLSIGVTTAVAQPVPLPSDVAVTLGASRTIGLNVGEPVVLTIAVTNLGPAPLSSVVLGSSRYTNEFEITQPVACPGLVQSVLDGEDSFFYYMDWFVAGIPSGSTLEVGQTNTCDLHIALTEAAPRAFHFTFGLTTYNTDPNPANDRDAVTFVRSLPTRSVPMLHPLLLMMLASLLGLCTPLSRVARSVVEQSGAARAR